jgi:hypothetical protein
MLQPTIYIPSRLLKLLKPVPVESGAVREVQESRDVVRWRPVPVKWSPAQPHACCC